MKMYKILICPNSETESEFIEIDYQTALEKSDELSAHEFIFHTKQELDAFIEGYHSAIGYLGEGYFKLREETQDH